MTTWIWKDLADNGDQFCATYDHEHSSISSHLLMGPKPIHVDAGVALLNAKRYSATRIHKYGCLPTARDERVVHRRLTRLLLSSVGDQEIQLFPITVIAKGGERLEEFFAVVTLNALPCTDISRSEITRWLAPEFPNPIAIGYKSLKHSESCLGHLSIVRDTITSHVVVSDKLKLALEATLEPGLYFTRPEDTKSYFV